MAREAGQPARVGVSAGRDLARRVGAGTVLGGNYYREGDRLHFEAQVVDARTGRLILALQPVIGPLREQTRVIELLRQRVMAGFAVVFQPGFNDWKGAGVPPTYAAYQAMLIAFGRRVDLQERRGDPAPAPGHRRGFELHICQGTAGLCPQR